MMNNRPDSSRSPLDALVHDVATVGAGVLRGVFSQEEVTRARERVMDHYGNMPNTRPYAGARHLAGFHRFPALEPLHGLLTGNALVQEAMTRLCGSSYRTIGLSDITVNRSQQWHKDLLRGKFARYLGDPPHCPAWHGTVFKLIAYLQDSDSLRVVPGSHRIDIDLSSDSSAIPAERAEIRTVRARVGDAVIIDICATHRGSPESAFIGAAADAPAKILISTVFGQSGAPLTGRLEWGNAARLDHWTRTHSPAL